MIGPLNISRTNHGGLSQSQVSSLPCCRYQDTVSFSAQRRASEGMALMGVLGVIASSLFVVRSRIRSSTLVECSTLAGNSRDCAGRLHRRHPLWNLMPNI